MQSSAQKANNGKCRRYSGEYVWEGAEICRQEFDVSDFLLAAMGNGQTNTFQEHQLLVMKKLVIIFVFAFLFYSPTCKLYYSCSYKYIPGGPVVLDEDYCDQAKNKQTNKNEKQSKTKNKQKHNIGVLFSEFQSSCNFMLQI